MKYIFTENQVKKIIDNQLNEQSMGGVKLDGTLLDMNYENIKPEVMAKVKSRGVRVVDVDNTGTGIKIDGRPAVKGQMVLPKSKITIPMSSYLYVTGVDKADGLYKGSISFGNNDKLVFSGYVG